MELFEHPYARFLNSVEKPTRYTGAEHGSRKKPWSEVEARVCLAFPDVYDIGMSHLGFRMLYKILNDDSRTLAERAYTPWIDMQRALKEHGKLLVALESGRPLCDFDVVGFSLQFELTYTNVLVMLDSSGIPLTSTARSEDDPLVIAGGPVATHAEPMARFIDAFLIGDGEEAATEIALCWVRAKRRGLSRPERLVLLSRLPGVYVPSLYSTHTDSESGLEVVSAPTDDGAPFPIQRRLLEDINRFPFPDTGPVGGPEAIFDRMSIEVARGCTEGCRFCQAGMIYRPVRERDPEQVIETVISALQKSGQDEVSLTALSTADVSCISPLIKQLVERTARDRVSLGVASLRAYGLAPELLDEMRKVRAVGLTFAPEAGTQRMRDVINKNVTEEQLMETAERVFSRGFDKMKLYFICGLPTEEDEDVLGIVEVGKNALAVGKRVGKRPKVTVSVSVHVPKPHTPFQWCALDSLDEIDRKQALLRSAARGIKGLSLRMHDGTASLLEGVLARGDRQLGPVIERAYQNGARFDSWDDQLNIAAWREAFAHFAIDTQRYLGTIPLSARLPWDHLDIGLEEGFLAREYRKALKSRLSPPCGKAVGMFIHHTNADAARADRRKLVCYDCGVACDLSKMREERVSFLERLSAKTPVDGQNRSLAASQPRPIPEPVPLDPAPDPLPDPNPGPTRDPAPVPPEPNPNPTIVFKGKPERHRPAQSGGVPQRHRLRFAKIGPAALLGHLDLIRELPRLIRRAQVKTAYTEGFHPKPDMSFGPALSLGVASLDEYVDAKLIDAPTPELLVERLNRVAPAGLEFRDAQRLTSADPSLPNLITAAEYVIALPELVIRELGGLDVLESKVRSFLAADQLRLRRDIKGIGKWVDVRSFVKELRVGAAAARDALDRASFVGRIVPLETTISISQQGSAKISEVVTMLFDDANFPHKALRTRLCAGAASPLELEAHRKLPREPERAAAAVTEAC